jgi:hypothetical protein
MRVVSPCIASRTPCVLQFGRLNIIIRPRLPSACFNRKRNPSTPIPSDDFIITVVSDFIYDRRLRVSLRKDSGGVRVVGEGIAGGCACVRYPRRLHILLHRPRYYLRRRCVADIDVDGRGREVKVSSPVGGRERDSDREFEEVLMVSTGCFVEDAPAVAVARRLNIIIYAPLYLRPRALPCPRF